jgi:hypothetical protein
MTTQLGPGDAGHDDARRIHNGMIDMHAAVIACCTSTTDVVDAVRPGCDAGSAADTSTDVLFGKWTHDKLVLLQCPDRSLFEHWAHPPEHVESATDRIAAVTSSVVPIAGVLPSPTVHRDDAELAEGVASVGPAAGEGELLRLIGEARRRNATPLLVAILADPTEPEVARQRAFGRIHTELGLTHRSGVPTVPRDDDAA